MSTISLNIQIDHSLEKLKGFVESIPDSQQIFILSDTNTKIHCWPILASISGRFAQAIHIEIPAGEENKNTNSLMHIIETLAIAHADKNTMLMNLGGGVVCDIGAFAASIYKRGISYIHIPTSLLAQVDAAIGGKNGIDNNNYKNILGTITFPKQVFISDQFLSTLPPNELKAGVAESIKHALIADKDYFNTINKEPLNHLKTLIERSVTIKTSIVELDPFEKNVRKKLNAGHTIGHALETYMLNNATPILHGEAVVAGLIMECYISKQLGYLSAEDFSEIKLVLNNLFQKINFRSDISRQLIELMKQDKKNMEQKICFSLIRNIGEASINDFCKSELIEEAISFYTAQ